MYVQPYLFFDGRTEEALEFYKTKLGATVDMLMHFKDNPEPGQNPPNSADKVMHAAFRVGDTQIMASDGHCAGKPSFQGFSLSISVAHAAEAEQRFAALAEGGQVQMPLGETFFADRFGMVTDRFGVGWMVIAEKKQ